MFRQEDVDRLIEQLNIVDVVGEFVELKKAGANYKGLCPFHADNNPSFSVNPQKNICKCFVCGAGGNPVSFYTKYKKISFTEAVRELSKKYNIPLQEIHRKHEEDEKYQRYRQIMDAAHSYFRENIFENRGREALAYLAKREVTPKMIRENALGYANASWDSLYNHLIGLEFLPEDLEILGLVKKNDSGKYYDVFRNRIIFPIYSKRGQCIAFGGRSLENNKEVPKYINSPDTPIFKKGKGLYGLERTQNIKQKNYAILMEGYMDVLSTLSYGFDTAVAPLGTALTTEQVKLLKRYTENIILSFDGDAAGQMAVERAIFLLKEEGFNIRVLQLQGAKDPDEFLKKFGKEAFLQQIRDSLEAFDFLYQYYKKEYSLDNVMSKQNFIERFQDFFASLDKELEQELYLQKFSENIGMEATLIRDLIFPKGKKIHKKKKREPSWEEEAYDIDTLVEEEKPIQLTALEETSMQLSILEIRRKGVWKEAKYYSFLKGMNYRHSVSQKIFAYLASLEEEGESISSELVFVKLRSLLTEDSDRLTQKEKDIFFDVMTGCLEPKKIEEQSTVICRDWARKMMLENGKVSAMTQIALRKIEKELLRGTFKIEDFIAKYQLYLKTRVEK